MTRSFAITAMVLILLVSRGDDFLLAADTPQQFARVVVIDTSASMDGERLNVAREELREMARQLPPSNTMPIVMIPFNSQALPTKTFSDPGPFQDYLNALRASGGTRIASGLAQGIAELKRYAAAPHVCVLLYTDGEDSERAPILEQEHELDKLFANRRTHGLRQTVVFCKRWGGVNADLVAQLSKSGNADVIDAAELKIVPFTVSPKLTVRASRWSGSASSRLEVLVDVVLHVGKTPPQTVVHPYLLRCLDASAQGDTKKTITPDATSPVRLQLSVDVPATQIAQGKTELEFELVAPKSTPTGDLVLLPSLPVGRLRVPVDLPPRTLNIRFSADLRAAGPPRWHNPLATSVELDVILAVELEGPLQALQAGDCTLQIAPDSDTRLLDGNDAVRITKPGRHAIRLTLSSTARSLHDKQPLQECAFGLSAAVVTSNKSLAVRPSSLRLTLASQLPTTVVTKVTARPRAVTKTKWQDLVDRTVRMSVDLDLIVDGPLEPDTVLTIQCPPPVRSLRLTPSTYRTGKQRIRCDLVVQSPSHAPSTLVFQIVPPSPQGAVQVMSTAPLAVSYRPPPVPQIALAQGRDVPAELVVSVMDGTDRPVLEVTPVLVGCDAGVSAKSLGASVEPAEEAQFVRPASGLAREKLLVPLDSTQIGARHFFTDTRFESQLVTMPHPANAAVRRSTQRLVVWVEAPIKRVAFLLASAVAGVITVLVLCRLAWRLISVDES